VNARLVFRALCAVVVIVAFGWLGIKECRADVTIASIEQNDDGEIKVGGLTFTFKFTNDNGKITDDAVTSDTFDNKYVVTAANVVVTTNVMTGGLTFTLNSIATLGGKISQTDVVTINYSVASTIGITGAGLSFSGKAMGDPTASSSVTEMLSDGTMMEVFTTNNGDNAKLNQSVAVPNLPVTEFVTDKGKLSIPNMGGAGSSTELTSITNTFTSVPEPSSFVVVSFTALVWLGVWRRGRKRVSARA